MVNPVIMIGGEERPINFGRNALAEFEELTGKALYDKNNQPNYQSFKTVRAMAYAGLKWGLYKGNGREPRPEFTLLTVGDWLEEDQLEAGGIVSTIMDCFLKSLAPKKKAQEEVKENQ